jgi:poly-gamma-glutamate system protein
MDDPRVRAPLLPLAAFLAALALGFLPQLLSGKGIDAGLRGEMLRAAEAMAGAVEALRLEAEARGLAIDPSADPRRSGLVGLPWSGTTTTLGSLPAKRTGIQPDAAALFVRLYREAGLASGGRVAIDSSGSFPGFAVAAAVAAESIGAGTRTVVSLGSSTWGANRPEYALSDIFAALRDRGILAKAADAVSAGGADDRGGDMEAVALREALDRAKAASSALIEAEGLKAIVAARRAILDRGARPALLVSIGGNWSSTGGEEELAGINGLILPSRFGAGGPPGEGLVQDYLREGIPVIRILDVAGLCASTGLAFDPMPLPAPGRAPLYGRGDPSRLIAAAAIVAAFLAAILLRRRAGGPRRGSARLTI